MRGGGAQRVILHLANELGARGHKVDIVLCRARGPYLDEISPRVNVVDLDKDRVLKSIPALVRYLRRHDPDATLSTLEHESVAVSIARALSRSDANYILRETTRVTDQPPEDRIERITRYLYRHAYHRSDGVVANSSSVAEDISKSFSVDPAKIEVIGNPVVTGELMEKRTDPVDHPWYCNEETEVVVGVGRLSSEKRFETLIDSMVHLREQRDVKLRIFGEGAKRDELADHVDLPGFVENPFKHMAAADAFALSSRTEGFGNVIVEAMACGTPVVATDCPGGPSEILAGGTYGELVPVDDPPALADALDRTLTDPLAESVLVKRANEYHVSTVSDAYEGVLWPEKEQ